MSNSSVREAFVASVACTRPPVSFQSSQRVDRAGEQLAASRARARAPGTSSRIHASLVAEKYGSSSSPVRADQLDRGRIAAELAAALRRAPVLPDDGAVHGLSRRALPHDDRLALHGDADAGHVLRREPGRRERLARARDRRGEDLVGVVLHPAVGGEVLRERLLHLREHGAVVGEDHGAGAGGAGVEREDGHGDGSGCAPATSGRRGWAGGSGPRTCGRVRRRGQADLTAPRGEALFTECTRAPTLALGARPRRHARRPGHASHRARRAACRAPSGGSYGHDPGGMRFSPLAQIDRGNVSRLVRAWTYHTGELETRSDSASGARRRRPPAFQTTPLMVDGVLYLSTPNQRVVALDAETGRERWTFDPYARRASGRARGSRTAASRTGRGGARAARRERAHPLRHDRRPAHRARTRAPGRPCPAFGEGGTVDLRAGMTDVPGAYGMTSPPAIYRDLVITGVARPGGAWRAARAATSARSTCAPDALVWRFHTVPREGEPGSRDLGAGIAGATAPASTSGRS